MTKMNDSSCGHRFIPVTVLLLDNNTVVGFDKLENSDDLIVKISYGNRKVERATNPMKNIYKNFGVNGSNGIAGIRICISEKEIYEDRSCSDLLNMLEVGDEIDIRGRTKGKGFQGVIKKYGFRTQDATHGNSLSHRAPGSIGQRQTPGRVFPGKKMAGHMGYVNVTARSKIMLIDKENNLIVVKGSVPGASGDVLRLRKLKKLEKKIQK